MRTTTDGSGREQIYQRAANPGVPWHHTAQGGTDSALAIDALGRPLRELRLSVTDRCNMRCVYCMPRDQFAGYRFADRSALLSFEELVRVTSVLVGLGVRKVRITGGEPLLRRELATLVQGLRALDVELSLTTNGLLLAQQVASLVSAGLDRVTVSLDALDPSVFRQVSDSNAAPSDVLSGIDAAARAGLDPVKVNCVVRRGLNESEIVPLAELFRGTGTILRFIEYMDVGQSNGWRRSEVLSAMQILQMLSSEWPLEPIAPARQGEPAQRYRYRDGKGEIGIIASVTAPFCSACTRLRLSATGDLHTCLFADASLSLRARLRGGCSDADLRREVVRVWQRREDRYSELRSSPLVKLRRRPEMSTLGG